MAIVVSVVITGMVAALAWVAGAQSQTTGDLSKVDQAFYAAESGAQRAIYYCRRRALGYVDTPTPPLTGTVNGYTYSAGWPTTGLITSVKITSTATNGTASYTLSETVAANVNPVPAIATGGNFNNKNIIIQGDVATNGSYSNGGSGSLNGDLYWSSNATQSGTVTGVVYPNQSFAPITEAQLNTKLLVPGSYSTASSGTGKTYDFRTANNRVFYVVGDVTDPDIPAAGGSGTLYVKGKITFTKPNVSLGQYTKVGTAYVPTVNVNLVATDVIEFNHKLDLLVGALYTLKDLKRQQISLLVGRLYAGGSITDDNNGQSTIIVGDTPTFDPRANNGVAVTTITVSKFTGPMP
jgi:hypothetical protein